VGCEKNETGKKDNSKHAQTETMYENGNWNGDEKGTSCIHIHIEILTMSRPRIFTILKQCWLVGFSCSSSPANELTTKQQTRNFQ